MHHLFIATLLVIFFLCSISVAAEGVKIEPGEWEMTSTTSSATLDQDHVQTTSRCIKFSELTANDLTPKRGECSISENSVTGNTLNWKVACKMQVGTMNGVGSFSSKGTAGSGNMDLDMHVQNDKFKVQVTWEARRLGDCK